MASRHVGREIQIAALLALLSACAGGSPVGQLSPEGLATLSSASIRPSAQHYGDDYVYSGQDYGNDLSVYRRHRFRLSLKKTLTKGILAPVGMVATGRGWWYVSNGGDSNVLVFTTGKQGPVGPVQTLDDRGEVPVNVAVSSDRNLVAVSNLASISGLAGSVGVYLHRSSKPSRRLTYGRALLEGAGVAIHDGNCYWSFNDPVALSGSVVEFDDCSGNGHVVVSGITDAGGIVFDREGNLFYVNEVAGLTEQSGIYKCEKLSNCTLAYTGFGLPTNINFDHKEKSLWVADATGFIDGIDLKTQKVHKIVSLGGDPFGVAPEPGD